MYTICYLGPGFPT